MDNAFADRTSVALLSTLDLLEQIRQGTKADPKAELARLKRLVDQFDATGGGDPEQELAKRAVVYWMDELLVNCDWEHAAYWQDHTLEREIYGTRQRAWAFFDKAKSAAALPRTDALELFYLCVATGFEGGYRQAGAETHGIASEPVGDSLDHAGTQDWEAIIEAKQQGGQRSEPASANVDAGDVGRMSQGTLEEWAEATYSRIATQDVGRFVPQAPSEPQGQAHPLEGLNQLKKSAAWTIAASLFALAMVVWQLVRTMG